MMKFQMACRAAEQGARCRTMVDSPAKFCLEHSGNPEIAPPPDVILIKFFNLPKKILAELEGGGLKRVPYRAETEEKHKQQAEKHGRDFYYLRGSVGDAGTAIFGKEGIGFMVIREAVLEILHNGFEISDTHIKERPNGPPAVVTTFIPSTVTTEVKLPEKTVNIIMDLLTSFRLWGKVRPFANPPQEDGKIVHTINCLYGGEIQPRQFVRVLQYAEGLWGMEEIPRESLLLDL